MVLSECNNTISNRLGCPSKNWKSSATPPSPGLDTASPTMPKTRSASLEGPLATPGSFPSPTIPTPSTSSPGSGGKSKVNIALSSHRNPSLRSGSPRIGLCRAQQNSYIWRSHWLRRTRLRRPLPPGYQGGSWHLERHQRQGPHSR